MSKLNEHFPKSSSKKFRSPGRRKAKRSQSKPKMTASESKCNDASLATTRRGVASSRHLVNISATSSFVIKKPFNPRFAPKPLIPPFALRLMKNLKRHVKAYGRESYADRRNSAMVQMWLKTRGGNPVKTGPRLQGSSPKTNGRYALAGNMTRPCGEGSHQRCCSLRCSCPCHAKPLTRCGERPGKAGC